jgi:hypothetical protein
MEHSEETRSMKTKTKIGMAIAALIAAGMFAQTQQSRSQPPRQIAHDVVFVQGTYILLRSSSSKHAPVFPEYSYTNPASDALPLAEVTAQLLDEGFQMTHLGMTEYWTHNLQFVRERLK